LEPNAAYFDNPGGFLVDFLNDSKVTPASRSLNVDILLFFLAAAILMVVEARKHGVRFVWAYILGGFAIAISVSFPLFLIACEMRIGRTEETRLGAVDTVLLVVFALVAAGLTLWVDMGRPMPNPLGRLGNRPARTQRGVHRPCPSLSSQP
jgi:hypothetical protein